MKKVIALVALTVGIGSVASAALITPDSVATSGAQGSASSGSSAARTIDGSGLSATLTDANLGTVTHANGFSGSILYLAQGTTTTPYDAILTYTFNTALTDKLGTIALWNFSQSGEPNRSADGVTISVNTGTGLNSIGTFTLTQNDGTTPVTSDLIDVSALNLVGVTEVAISLNQTKLDGFSNYTTGLSEVAFQTIPEPATLGMIAVFGGGILFIRRKLMI